MNADDDETVGGREFRLERAKIGEYVQAIDAAVGEEVEYEELALEIGFESKALLVRAVEPLEVFRKARKRDLGMRALRKGVCGFFFLTRSSSGSLSHCSKKRRTSSSF